MFSKLDTQVTEGSVSVFIRIRGGLQTEESRCCEILSNNKTIQVRGSTAHEYTFDHIFGQNSSQDELFQLIAKRVVDNSLSGYNATIFAYGQTGSGKTYTMTGQSEGDVLSKQGIIPRSISYLFSVINDRKTKPKDIEFKVKCTFLEVYNEKIYDLLDHTNTSLQPRERNGAVFVEGLSEMEIEDDISGFEVFLSGNKNRKVGSTCMNRESSRSHSVFTLIIVSKAKQDGLITIKRSLFNLVDLAGSERQTKTKTVGASLKEAAKINQSLSSLGKVIKMLSETTKQDKQQYINYRDSKLTFILKDSLGGNSFCSIIANVSPLTSNFAETISTIQFATRAKSITNIVKCNEDKSGSIEALKNENGKLHGIISMLMEENKSLKQMPNMNVSHSITTNITQSMPMQEITEEHKLETMKLMYIQKIKDVRNKTKELTEFQETAKALQEENRLMRMRLKLKNKTINSFQALIPEAYSGLSKIDNDLISKGITLRSGDYNESRRIEFNKEYLDRWYAQRKEIQILEKQNTLNKKDVKLFAELCQTKTELKAIKTTMKHKFEIYQINERLKAINEDIMMESEDKLIERQDGIRNSDLQEVQNRIMEYSELSKQNLLGVVNVISLVNDLVGFSSILINIYKHSSFREYESDMNKCLKTSNNELKKEIFDLKNDLESRAEESAIINEDNKVKELQIASLSEENSKLRLQIQILNNKFVDASEQSNTSIVGKNEAIQRKDGEINDLLNKLRSLEVTGNELTCDNELYKTTIRDQEHAIEKMHNELLESKTENGNLVGNNEELMNNLSSLENQHFGETQRLNAEIKKEKLIIENLTRIHEQEKQKTDLENTETKKKLQILSNTVFRLLDEYKRAYKDSFSLKFTLQNVSKSNGELINIVKEVLHYHTNREVCLLNLLREFGSIHSNMVDCSGITVGLCEITSSYETEKTVMAGIFDQFKVMKDNVSLLQQTNAANEETIATCEKEIESYVELIERYKDEIYKLSGQQNTAQRIKYHQKIKLENEELKRTILALERRVAKDDTTSSFRKVEKEQKFVAELCKMLKIQIEEVDSGNSLSELNISVSKRENSKMDKVREKIMDIIKMKEKYKKEWRKLNEKIKNISKGNTNN
eukprot:GAHX01000971.1.p1 GENE.GAHX01000971.1~~GAHX01000971.1.p1  ORF type:complete len:1118 (-),score=269.63 GAHX01000971.1:28-3381(-)